LYQKKYGIFIFAITSAERQIFIAISLFIIQTGSAEETGIKNTASLLNLLLK